MSLSIYTNLQSASAHWCMTIPQQGSQRNKTRLIRTFCDWRQEKFCAWQTKILRRHVWIFGNAMQLSLLAAMIQSRVSELDMVVHKVPSLLISIYALLEGHWCNSRYLPEANEASYISKAVNPTFLCDNVVYTSITMGPARSNLMCARCIKSTQKHLKKKTHPITLPGLLLFCTTLKEIFPFHPNL